MKTLFMFQSTSIGDVNNEKLLKALENADADWQDYGMMAFCNELFGMTDAVADRVLLYARVIMFGSTKMLELFLKYPSDDFLNEVFPLISDPQKKRKLFDRMKMGIFYGHPDLFDQTKYAAKLGPLLLNSDAKVMPFNAETLDTYFEEAFVKPGSDRKYFLAGVIQNMTLRTWLGSQMQMSDLYERFFDIVVAPVKRTKAEYRFFVVDGKVVAQSLYFSHGVVRTDARVPQFYIDRAQAVANTYAPHPVAYCVDLCELYTGEVLVVEYNCFNCSGFYAADVSRIINALMG